MTEASTITMICTLEGEVEISTAYDILPVIYPLNPDGTRFYHPIKTRNKIPFFGVKDAIVCVKYKGSIRGIRQNEGQMNNVISIDLQCCNKNINLKLARSKIQLTGASSEEMGNEAFQVLCNHINSIHKELNYIKELTDEVKNQTVNSLIENTKNQDDDSLVELSYDVYNFLIESGSDELLLKYLYKYIIDCKTHLEFENKIKRIMTYKNISDKEISITSSRISNSVYNYNLGKEISLISLTNHLYKKGLNVSFHNWNSTHLNVSIPIFGESTSKSSTPSSNKTFGTDDTTDLEEEDKETSNEKIKVHRFIIYRGGSIKQTSPTSYIDAIGAKNILMNCVKDFV
jgi:hypothetical protein